MVVGEEEEEEEEKASLNYYTQIQGMYVIKTMSILFIFSVIQGATFSHLICLRSLAVQWERELEPNSTVLES